MDGEDDAEGMPRWVKLLLGAGALVAAVVVVLHLMGASPGGHGP